MPLTTLEALEIIREGLLKQGERSEDDTGCKYRGLDGKKCAIGWLIPDEHYRPIMEHRPYSWFQPVLERYTFGRPLEAADYYMLDAVLNLHDYEDPKTWAERFDHIEDHVKMLQA